MPGCSQSVVKLAHAAECATLDSTFTSNFCSRLGNNTPVLPISGEWAAMGAKLGGDPAVTGYKQTVGKLNKG